MKTYTFNCQRKNGKIVSIQVRAKSLSAALKILKPKRFDWYRLAESY